jgi:hypothetical protein
MNATYQTIAQDSFCPLTNPQPYQREQDELLRPGTGAAAGEIVEVIENKIVRRVAVSSIAWLDAASGSQ